MGFRKKFRKLIKTFFHYFSSHFQGTIPSDSQNLLLKIPYTEEKTHGILEISLLYESFCTWSYLIILANLLYMFFIMPFTVILNCVQYFCTSRVFTQRGLFQIFIFVLISTAIFISFILSPAYIYHWIRGQNTLKIYVMFGFLDMSDNLLRKMGHCNIENICVALKNKKTTTIILVFIQALIYTEIHTFILFLQMLTLFVAFNSSTNSLLILLLSTNFAEIKVSLFKRIDFTMLFKTFCGDIVERVQFFIFFAILFAQQTEQWIMLSQKTCILIGAEICVDWLKYTMFTRIYPNYIQYYLQFYNGLFVEIVKSKLKYSLSEPAETSKIFTITNAFPRCTESQNIEFYANSMEHFLLLSKNLNFVTLPQVTLIARFCLEFMFTGKFYWITWILIILNVILLYCLLDLWLYSVAISKSCFKPDEKLTQIKENNKQQSDQN